MAEVSLLGGFDIKSSIEALRDGWVDDLFSDDEAVQKHAQIKISECLDWLLEPTLSDRREARQAQIEQSLIAGGMGKADAQAIAKLGSSATGCRCGAPRKTGTLAVRALMEKLRTGKSYREIALTLGGPCRHVCPACNDTIRRNANPKGPRPRKSKPRCTECKSTIRAVGQKEQVCTHCADALRASIKRLKEFLRREGIELMEPGPDLEIPVHPGIAALLRRWEQEPYTPG